MSYAHADAAQAGRLQRRLESYRIPDRIGDLAPFDPARPRSLGPIFRDREDLSAASDLSQAVREALEASCALIVVCTPNTPRSQWVAREIELFRELHPERPVLAALFAGEPAEAFPAPLTVGGVEPLAADFRKRADGEKLAFLKVVAGVLDVPLDQLIQRDAQRHMRRVMFVTAASVVLALVMAAMTMTAISARNEAQRQRGEAEGLIEYMLTDLRSELLGVGRLEVMAGVNDRAMDYYEGQGDLSEFSDDSLERRARLMQAMGEDAEKAGDYAKASRYFEEAYRQTQELLKRSPGNAGRIFAHAQSEYWVGYAGWQANDAETAHRHWQGYLDQAQALAQVEPDTARSNMELGYAHGNMCEVSMRLGEAETALGHCRKAIEFERAALAIEPGNEGYKRGGAPPDGWLADVLLKLGRTDEAEAARKRESAIIDALLAADRDDAETQMRSVYPLVGLTQIRLQQSDYAGALAAADTADRRLQALAEADPANQHVTAMRLRVAVMKARVFHASGDARWRTARAEAKRLFDSRTDDEGGPVARLANEVKRMEEEIASD